MAEDKNEFAGDVLLKSTLDGGDIVIEDGLVKDCRNFDTAAFLSLFGGNKKDVNGRPKETWWGNLLPGTKKKEWIQSEFGAMSEGLPITGANLLAAKSAALRDLDWIKSDAGAEEVAASIRAENPARTKLTVEIKKQAAAILGGEYETQWQGAVK